jgi:hypothetical protein
LNSNRDEEDMILKQRNSNDESLNPLDTQLTKLESNLNMNMDDTVKEEMNKKLKSQKERISSIPSMLKCYICEDYCEDAVQITCCFENFCDKHIREEIMQNFTCPNCNKGATIRDIVPNKKLRENIEWIKSLISEQNVGMNIATHPSAYISAPVSQDLLNTAAPYVSKNILPNLPVLEKKSVKMDIDHIAESNEQDMTPEEKMQLYNKKLTESDSRKKSEDKVDDSKSHTSGEKKSVKEMTSGEKPVIHPIMPGGMMYPGHGHMPYPMPVPTMGYPPRRILNIYLSF